MEKELIESSENFRPSDFATREEVAVILAKMKGLDGKQRATEFNDVTAKNKNSGYIHSISKARVIHGYADGEFKPDWNVQRGHMAVFINRVLELDKPENMKAYEELENPKEFKDVPEMHPARYDIQKLFALGIVSGYRDNTFKPNTYITRLQMAVYVARAHRYLETGSAK